jgi:hypothetical protein
MAIPRAVLVVEADSRFGVLPGGELATGGDAAGDTGLGQSWWLRKN